MAALETLFADVQSAVTQQDWDAAAAAAGGYAQAPDFNAHAGLALADLILPHEPLQVASQVLLARCLETNSLDDLARLGPGNATPLKLAMDAGRAHSALALVHLKRGDAEAADRQMELALAQLSGPAAPLAVDWLRAGLVDQALGRPERAWERVANAIEMDTAVELQDPFYETALAPLVEARSGGRQGVAGYLDDWRRQHAPEAPDLPFVGADDTRFTLGSLAGTTVLLNFFSPACSSCRMEVPAVHGLWGWSLDNPDVEVLFVLNNPDLADRVPPMLAGAGLDSARVVTLAEGSVYDYIPGEPTVWIVDAEGRLRARHTGYGDGDEAIYEAELRDIAAPARACDCGH